MTLSSQIRLYSTGCKKSIKLITMETMQLYFEELDWEMYISKTCKEFKRECKVYCITNNADIYCNKYKKHNKM